MSYREGDDTSTLSQPQPGPIMWIGRPRQGDSLARGLNARTVFAQTAHEAKARLAVEMGIEPMNIDVEMVKSGNY